MIDGFEGDEPMAYVPLDPDTAEDTEQGTYALDGDETDAVVAAQADDNRAEFGATKEVGPHLIVAVKSRRLSDDLQVWMCRECDARRKSAADFVEVDCE